ncbi:MAG TPA: response regulator [Burkholderiales bacterium]|nr:response regulator [Burkholderiales bacterium]
MAKPRILVVDDDEAVLEFMRAKLSARYTILGTTDPQQVLALARSERPQLILCDIEMPGLDGGDLSAALYAQDDLRDIPVLFLTALVSQEDLRAQQGQLGGRAAISKEAPVAELMARIDSLIQ